MANDVTGGFLATASTPPYGLAAIFPLPNIAALRALTSLTLVVADAVIYVASYAAVGGAVPDGGGGYFKYTASDTTSADNSATIIVDVAHRRWYRVWDQVHFQAAWAGIFPGNADNGPLISRIPKFCECWLKDGVYTFATYPSLNDFSRIFWRGYSYIFNCTGSLGADFDQTKLAFDWSYAPDVSIFDANLIYAAGGSAGDMTTAGLSPIEGVGILSQLDGNAGVGLRLGGSPYPPSPPAPFPYPENYYLRPKNFSVGGFFINVGWTVPFNCFLTGCENVVVKRGNIGFYFNETAVGESNSGENLILLNCNMNGMIADGYEFFAAQRWTLDGCSLTYNHRMGFSSNQYTVFKSCYFETNAANTPGSLIAVDGDAIVVFDQGTSILGLPFSNSDLIFFGGGGANTRVWFRDTAVYNSGFLQFLIATAGLNARGRTIGFNGNNYPTALCPDMLMQPDWNFASGGLTLYPGSSGVTNQGAVVHSPQTRAASFTGTATLQLSTMAMAPYEIIQAWWYDKVVGSITSVGGVVTFLTEDGVTISTSNFSGNTSVHDWATTFFSFFAPAGTSKMTMTITTTGGGNYYVSELQVYR